jgi:two-component system, OmpR family, phosphate regulon sensor histidine kinase PhoR
MRKRFWLPLLLIAILGTGILGWSATVRSEVARLEGKSREQMDLVATALRENAVCVQLQAQRQLPSGSSFFLMVPGDVTGGAPDTIATYLSKQDGKDTEVRMTTLPVPTAAVVDITLRMRFLAPIKDQRGHTASAIENGVSADVEQSVWMDQQGNKLKLLDTLLLVQLMEEHMRVEPFDEVEFAVVDTQSCRVLYTSTGADPLTLRSEGMSQPIFARDQSGVPLVLYVHHPGKTMSVARAESPIIGAFLLLIGVLSALLWQYARTIGAREKLAQMQIDLVSNITHELNTPIANIALALDTLKKAPSNNSRISNDQLWDIIHVENKRLHANIKKVLDVSMLEGSQLMLMPEMHDMNVMLATVAEEFQLAARKRGATIDLDLRARRPWVRADATYITNVLHSLIDNAIKYGGDHTQVSLRTSDHAAGVVVEVCDNGPGIPKTERELVFEKFYRVRNGDRYAVKGTGIGLYYARQVIEAHGGWITLANVERAGCCFQLMIPSESKANDKAANS